jgi:hypothetical protein
VVKHEAALIFLKKRPDYMAIVECIGESGATWLDVVECAMARGLFKSISNVRYRIGQLVKYGVVEQYRFGKNTFLVLNKDFVKTWRKITSRGLPEKKP